MKYGLILLDCKPSLIFNNITEEKSYQKLPNKDLHKCDNCSKLFYAKILGVKLKCKDYLYK